MRVQRVRRLVLVLFGISVFQMIIRTNLSLVGLTRSTSDKPSSCKEIMLENVEPKPDTTIIVLSSLSPSSPDTTMVEKAIDSAIQMLDGLSPRVPIIIAVDNLVEEGSYFHQKQRLRPNTSENRNKLEEYVRNLRLRFKDDNRVTVLAYVAWQMHYRAIKYALEMVDTKYVYVLQHDEFFLQRVDHAAMVQAMEEYPDILKKIEFNRDRNIAATVHYWHRGPCSRSEDRVNTINGIRFTKTSGWSDQCHFTTKAYYAEIDKILDPHGKNQFFNHPEAPMNRHAHRYCEVWGAHFYGNLYQGPFIHHVNGRFNKGDKLSKELNFTTRQAN